MQESKQDQNKHYQYHQNNQQPNPGSEIDRALKAASKDKKKEVTS